MTPAGAAEMEEIVARAIAEGDEFDGPLEIVAGPRAGHWIRWRGRATAGSSRMLHGVTFDITEQKRAEEQLRDSEERHAFLLKLSDRLRQLSDPLEIMAAAAALTGPHLGLDRCFYGEVDATLAHVYLADAYCAQGIPPFPQRIRIDDFSEEIVAIIATGATIAVDDIRSEPRLIDPAQSGRFLAAQIRAIVGVPLVKGGRLVAILSAHQSSARQWAHNDIAMLEEVAERTWAAVERARAEAALRESDERQAFLLQLSDALRPIADPVRIMSLASEALGRHLGAGRSGYGEVDPTGEYFTVARDWTDGVMPSFRGTHLLEGFGPEFVAAYRAARTVLIDDALADARAAGKEAAFEAAGGVRASLGVPMLKEGRFVAGIFVQQLEPRHWTAQEEALAVEVAERTWAAVERARAQEALRDSEERFREFGENSSDALWIVDVETMRLEYLSPAFERIWGQSREAATEDLGRWAELIHPEDREVAAQAMPRTIAGSAHVVDYRILRPDGDIRWIRDTGFPMRENGGVRRVGGIAQDVTDLKRAEAHQRVLLAELQHRVRNSLAVVRSITRRTAQNSESVEEMAAHLEGRIDAFARVQAAVTRDPSGRIDFAMLIEEELLAYVMREGKSVELHGPDVLLAPKVAETLSLAVHELATNAVKHGALANGGRLDVRWELDEAADRFSFAWDESGIALPDTEPERRGFGMELLKRVLPYEMQAETRVAFRPKGLRFDLEMPAAPGVMPKPAI